MADGKGQVIGFNCESKFHLIRIDYFNQYSTSTNNFLNVASLPKTFRLLNFIKAQKQLLF
jgi:hypothetical protein